jgi:hypothetical protein
MRNAIYLIRNLRSRRVLRGQQTFASSRVKHRLSPMPPAAPGVS